MSLTQAQKSAAQSGARSVSPHFLISRFLPLCCFQLFWGGIESWEEKERTKKVVIQRWCPPECRKYPNTECRVICFHGFTWLSESFHSGPPTALIPKWVTQSLVGHLEHPTPPPSLSCFWSVSPTVPHSWKEAPRAGTLSTWLLLTSYFSCVYPAQESPRVGASCKHTVSTGFILPWGNL